MISLFNAAVSLYNRLASNGGHDTSYDGKTDTVTLGFSIGSGRSSTRVELPQSDVVAVAQVLTDWDPDATLSIPETVRRSLTVETDDDGTEWYVFRTSDEKNARNNRVPVEHFAAIVELVNSHDPSAERSAADVARDTLTRKGDVVSFKVSDAPNTRAVRVSSGDFADLARFMTDAGPALEAAREQYAAMSAPAHTPQLGDE
jgi:hypothetical protein